jgi:hypothetical protein
MSLSQLSNNYPNKNVIIRCHEGIFDSIVNSSGVFNHLLVTDTTQSTSANTGSIVNKGGMGLARDLYMGGGSNIWVDYLNSSSNPSIEVNPISMLYVANQTDSTSISSGALIVDGGVGIAKNLTATTANINTLKLQNNVTTISASNTLSLYSYGKFSITMGGPNISSATFNVSYTRIGTFITLMFPEFTFGISTATPTALRSTSTIPLDLQSSTTSFPGAITSMIQTAQHYVSVSYNTSLQSIYMYQDNSTGFTNTDGVSIIVSPFSLSYLIF